MKHINEFKLNENIDPNWNKYGGYIIKKVEIEIKNYNKSFAYILINEDTNNPMKKDSYDDDGSIWIFSTSQMAIEFLNKYPHKKNKE
jgi:hypothetical protein